MKQYKRGVSLLLDLCLVLSMACTAVLADRPFRDVQERDWFYQAVQYVYENKMMSGTGADAFSPNATTTRGMIVTVLHRMEGSPEAGKADFTDVEPGQYYAGAVAWAAENQIVGGYGGGRFGPNDPITREQMAAILYRYAQFKEYDVSASGDLSVFSDASAVHDYGLEPLNWAIGCGLISGMGNGTLSPQGNATRAQIAVILMRFKETVVLGNPLPEPEKPDEETESEEPKRPEPVLTGPTFVVDTVDAAAGASDVAVTVAVKQNPGISALALVASYDEDLELTSVEYHEEAGGQTMLPQTIKNPVKLLWINALENVEGDFVLATLHFNVSADAAPGYHQISLTYNPEDVYNLAEINVEFAVSDGAIVVEK